MKYVLTLVLLTAVGFAQAATPPPTNLIATVTNSQVALSWAAPTPDPKQAFEGYNVSRDGVSIATGAQLGSITSTTYTDSNVATGTHTYAVNFWMCSASACSPVSANATVSAAVGGAPPPPPPVTVTVPAQITVAFTCATGQPAPVFSSQPITGGTQYNLVGACLPP